MDSTRIKPATLQQQVRAARKEVAAWTPERRAAVQLEGYDYNARYIARAALGRKA